MTLRKIILYLILTLLSSLTFGQIGKVTTAAQKDSLFEIKWLKQQDSLRTEFYKKPKTLKLIFEKNGKVKTFKGSFFISIDSNEFKLTETDMGNYDIGFKIDSHQTIVLKVKFGRETLSQKLSDPTEIKNGATIVFGIVNNIRSKSIKGIKRPKGDNSLSPIDNFYNSIFRNDRELNIIREQKIKRVNYCTIIPRVFGCGTSNTYRYFKKKNHS
jgi:hypothetical protein